MKNASPLASPVLIPPNSLIPHILIVEDDSGSGIYYGFTSAAVIPRSRSGSGEEALALLAHRKH